MEHPSKEDKLPLEPHDFKRGLCAIYVKGNREGTGFFVSPTLAVTCAHVIDSRAQQQPSPDIKIKLYGDDAKWPAVIAEWRAPDAEDLAILECHCDSTQLSPIRLREAGDVNRLECETFGYPPVGGMDGLAGVGTVVGVTTQEGTGFPFLQIDSKQFTHGYSGAPLMDPGVNRAIGIVASIVRQGLEHLEGRHDSTAFAIPIRTLKQMRADLFVETQALEEEHRRSIERLQKGASLELGRSEAATDHLADKIADRFGEGSIKKLESSERPSKVTEILFRSPLEDVLDIVIESFHELSVARDESSVLALTRFGKHVFPVVYDEKQLRDIRSEIESGSPFIRMPSTSMTIFEILMAGVDGREAEFSKPFGSDNLPTGRHQILPPPECGLAEDPFQKLFEEALFELLKIPAPFRDRAKLNAALEIRIKANRRFYYVFDSSSESRIDDQQNTSIEQLKQLYPKVVFIKRLEPVENQREFELLYRVQEMFGATRAKG